MGHITSILKFQTYRHTLFCMLSNMKTTTIAILASCLFAQALGTPIFNILGGRGGGNDRPKCHTVYAESCHNTYEKECSTSYGQECSTSYEQQCSTSYGQEC